MYKWKLSGKWQIKIQALSSARNIDAFSCSPFELSGQEQARFWYLLFQLTKQNWAMLGICKTPRVFNTNYIWWQVLQRLRFQLWASQWLLNNQLAWYDDWLLNLGAYIPHVTVWDEFQSCKLSLNTTGRSETLTNGVLIWKCRGCVWKCESFFWESSERFKLKK